MDETDSEKPALYALRAQASAQEIDQRLRVRDILEEHQGMLAVAGAIEHLGGSVKPGPTVEIDDSSFLISGAVSPTGHNKARISIVTQSGRAVIQFGVFGKQDESLWRPLRPCVLFGLPSEDGTSFGWNSLHLPLQPV